MDGFVQVVVSGPEDAEVNVRLNPEGPHQVPGPARRVRGIYPAGLSVHGQYMVVSVPFGPFFGNSC